MNLKIFLLVSIFVSVKLLNIKGFKRIKRNSDAKGHNSRVKQDFIMLHSEKRDAGETLQKNQLKADASAQHVNHNISNILASDFVDKTQNISKSLGEKPRKLDELLRLDGSDMHGGEIDDENSKLLENSLEKSGYCDINGKPKETLKYHKTKRLPHIVRSTGIVEAKVLLSPQNFQPPYRGLSSFASMEELMKMGNTMTFKVGMGSLPYTSHYPRKHIVQSSPEASERDNFNQVQNEPSFDYTLNSLEGSPENYFRPQSIKLFNEDGLSKHAIIYKPAVSIREPIQLANLMQTALDTILADSDEIEDNKNLDEIDFRCPIHHEKKSIQNGGAVAGDGADVVQVCSCRFIKKAKEADKKKLK